MSLFRNWLASCQQKKARTVVLGSQAADLDSMVSSALYAFLCSLRRPEKPVLPLMTIPRADFSLRREAVFVFGQAGISADHLVFWDEVDSGELLRQAELILIDHNALPPNLEQFSGRVAGIVDHHHDSGLHPQADPRIVRPVGSAATLVALEWRKSGFALEQDVALLLAGTILLDTVNLAEEAGRVTEADREAAAFLLPRCPLPPTEYFNKIQQEKFNVQGFSTADLLRKDYKEQLCGPLRCGIASIPLSVQDWLAQDADLAAGFAAFARQKGLDLLLATHSCRNPEMRRELSAFCPTQALHDRLIRFLQDSGLELTPLPHLKQPAKGFMAAHRQGNLMMSRKKLMPILAEFRGY